MAMMRPATPVTIDEVDERFDEIIDVRSPSEFEEDHLAGAINLPVLDDEERVRIGTTYKQTDAFLARREGAAIVAERAAVYIRGHFADKDPSYFPLVYCWRGGMRSNSLAVILSSIGWRVCVLEGGYREYRRSIVKWFAETERIDQLRFIVIAGLTGSGKTDILHVLAENGNQVLDLEGLAIHRGSLLGNEPDQPQPSQKYFESQLYRQLRSFDPERPVFVESESHRIGRMQQPSRLWKKIKESPVIEIAIPRSERARYLLEGYDHFCKDAPSLKGRLALLKGVRGQKVIDAWSELIDSGQWTVFVEDILEHHYDPAYLRSRKSHFQTAIVRIEEDDISPNGIEKIAEKIVQAAAKSEE
jgi:tRNA 2-selenouridine synthase